MNMGGFNKLLEWIMKLAYVNILWIAFTLLGVIILGIFPATTSLFTIVRKWVLGDTDIPVFQTFWTTYKKELLRSNVLGLLLFIMGFILYTDFIFLKSNDINGLLGLTFYPLLIFILIYILAILYVFPVFVHYEVSYFNVLKNAFLIMIMSPLITLMMVVGIVIVYYLLRFLPGLTPFLGISLMAYIIMWSSNLAFDKVERFKIVGAEKEVAEKNN